MKQAQAHIPIRRTKVPAVRTLSAQDRAHAVEEMEMERKRAPTAKPPAADVDTADPAYIERLRRSMYGAINFARRRQAKKASPVVVEITLDELMEILDWQDYRCAISRLPFWCGSPVAYGPTIPSLDRIQASKGYTRSNIRVVLLGVNGLRGSGTNDDMLLIARAVMKNGPKAIQARNWHEGARKAWAKRRAGAASTSQTPSPER
jgi:hypothetical protein